MIWYRFRSHVDTQLYCRKRTCLTMISLKSSRQLSYVTSSSYHHHRHMYLRRHHHRHMYLSRRHHHQKSYVSSSSSSSKVIWIFVVIIIIICIFVVNIIILVFMKTIVSIFNTWNTLFDTKTYSSHVDPEDSQALLDSNFGGW